jgi:hypothetical protein
VFWYVKRKRPANATQAGTVPLQNTPYRGAQIQNQQPNTQFSGFNNPTAFQNHPQHGNNVAQQSHNPSHYPQGFQYGAQGTPNQGLVSQIPANSPQQGNENHGFHINPSPNNDDQGHHTAMSSYPTQSNNEVTVDATQDAQYQDR